MEFKLKYTPCAKQNGGCKNIILTINIELNERYYYTIALHQSAFPVGFLLLSSIVHLLRYYLFVLYLTCLKS